jgi:hypothetical protein
MSSFVSSSSKSKIQSKMDDLFDTYSDPEQGGATITIHKEPKKVISSVSSRNYAGYGSSSNPQNYTFLADSDSFPAIVTYQKDQSFKALDEIGLKLEDGECLIEVKIDCKNYIENGVLNERVDIDSRSFNIVSEAIEDKFFGSLRYIYKLKEAK